MRFSRLFSTLKSFVQVGLIRHLKLAFSKPYPNFGSIWSKRSASAEVWRNDLEAFVSGKLDVEELARRHPLCACENAVSPNGSPGPVQAGEIIRLFLMSRSDINGEKANLRQRRPFKAGSLERAFTRGLSVVRLTHADQEELEYTASKLHAFQFEKSEKFGGVLAVMDFPVEAVRDSEDAEARMCVLETPLDCDASGKFLRPSHADVVYSRSGIPDELKKAKREVIYNQIVQKGRQLNAEDVRDCNLAQFLPQVIKDEGRAAS